jgi:hypothetical protein
MVAKSPVVVGGTPAGEVVGADETVAVGDWPLAAAKADRPSS